MAEGQQGPSEFALREDISVETRRAQALSSEFIQAVHGVCARNRSIAACYVLDVRYQSKEWLLIAIVIDQNSVSLDALAVEVSHAVCNVPEGPRVLIKSAGELAEDYRGSEFYLRS